MNHDYTKRVKAQFESPVIMNLKRTSADFLSKPPETDAEEWQRQLAKIAQEFRLSARFCLVRILHQRACNQNRGTADSFWVETEQGRYTFSDLTMEHVEVMPGQESEAYCAYMQAIAGTKTCPAECDMSDITDLAGQKWTPENYEKYLIRKAWNHRLQRGEKHVLSRREAFRLGHMLEFDRSEMESFLLRVFDYEEGFRFDTSNDLIEAYGLQEKKHWLAVEKLKKEYQDLTGKIPKEERESRDQDWTWQNDETSTEGFASDEAFLDWMQEIAWGLDTGSRTARRIYRNFAAECLDLSAVAAVTDLDDWISGILKKQTETERARELLFEGDEPSEAKCVALAQNLIRRNWETARGFGASKKKSWNVLTLSSKESKLSASDGEVNRFRRMKDLLYGTEQVEKSDLIFMIWVIANQLWVQKVTDPEILSLRLMGFIESCNKCLAYVGLPPFYIPHLLEQSMLMAIVHNGMADDNLRPAEAYEKILNLEKGSRENDGGHIQHPPEDRLLLVKLYRKMLEFNRDEFAQWAGISVASLNRWQSDFIQMEILKPFDRKKEQKDFREKNQNEWQILKEKKTEMLKASDEERAKALAEAMETIRNEEAQSASKK